MASYPREHSNLRIIVHFPNYNTSIECREHKWKEHTANLAAKKPLVIACLGASAMEIRGIFSERKSTYLLYVVPSIVTGVVAHILYQSTPAQNVSDRQKLKSLPTTSDIPTMECE